MVSSVCYHAVTQMVEISSSSTDLGKVLLVTGLFVLSHFPLCFFFFSSVPRWLKDHNNSEMLFSSLAHTSVETRAYYDGPVIRGCVLEEKKGTGHMQWSANSPGYHPYGFLPTDFCLKVKKNLAQVCPNSCDLLSSGSMDAWTSAA